MRILDLENNKSLKNVLLYLKLDEAKELISGLQDLIDNLGQNQHVHINDEEYLHEITAIIYEDEKFDHFNERSIKLIKYDE